jgi:hypothetical protein
METRIKEQEALIEELRESGSDTAEAARTLNLMLAAMEEMRCQFAQLTRNAGQDSNPRK